jgi:hypothetical protein
MKKWIIPFLLVLLVACVKDELTPEGALRTFTEARFGNVITRQFVLDRVTGKMKQSFEIMSDEDFDKFADLRSIRSGSFKILSKSCQEKKCFVTYSVAYKTKNEEASFSSEVKKIAELVLIEGKWLIADVSNIKTYHESLEPISALE